MARSSHRRVFNRPAIAWSWSALLNAGVTPVAANTDVLIGSLVPTINAQMTIERVRGRLTWFTDNIIAAEEQLGVWGMAVVSSDALGAGITALPSPAGDPNYPWFAYEMFASFHVAGTDGFNSQSMVIDSKARRILGPAEVIVIVVSNLSTANAFTFWSGVRVLSRVR